MMNQKASWSVDLGAGELRWNEVVASFRGGRLSYTAGGGPKPDLIDLVLQTDMSTGLDLADGFLPKAAPNSFIVKNGTLTITCPGKDPIVFERVCPRQPAGFDSRYNTAQIFLRRP